MINKRRRNVLLVIGLIISFCSCAQSDSLIYTLESIKNLSLEKRVDTLVKMSRAQDYPSSQTPIPLALKALEISRENEYGVGMAKSYKVLGNAYVSRSQYEQAKASFARCVTIYDSLQKEKESILCLIGLANMNTRLGQYEESIRISLKALAIAEAENSALDIADIQNNIGLTLTYQKKYDQAKTYLMRAIEMNPPKWLLHIVYENLSNIYLQQNQADSAIYCNQKSMELCNDQSDPLCDVYALSNISSIYRDQEDYLNAVAYAMRAIAKLEGTSRHSDLLIFNYNNLGMIYIDQERYEKSIEYLNKALTLSDEVKLGDAFEIHQNLSEVYAATKRYKKALFHNNRYWELQDSLLSLEKSNQVEAYLAKYESEKKEKEIALLKKESELKDAEAQRQTQLKKSIMVGAALILVILLVIVFIYRQKNIYRKQLLFKNEEINKQKILELIRDHELKAIKANLDGQEKEKQRVSSELHDGISGNLAGIKMMLSKVEGSDADDGSITAVINRVDNTYNEVRSITHQLTPPGISTASFGQLIRSFLSEISSNDLNIRFITHPEEDLDYLNDETKIEIYRIIQELINNVIKHARSKKVIVQLVVSDDSVNLIVEDDGVGFDARKVNGGLGLSNIQSRVTKVNGEIDIDSVSGRGTVINIDIPLNYV